MNLNDLLLILSILVFLIETTLVSISHIINKDITNSIIIIINTGIKLNNLVNIKLSGLIKSANKVKIKACIYEAYIPKPYLLL